MQIWIQIPLCTLKNYYDAPINDFSMSRLLRFTLQWFNNIYLTGLVLVAFRLNV